MDPSTIDSATTHADLKSVFIERAVEDIERQNPSRSHEDHLSEWIGNASALSDNDQVILDPEDGSLASRLYASCMQVLQGICVRLSASKAALPGVNLGTLKEELAKLYLLGEGMNNGKLDKALQDADDLREIFLEVLVSIGRLLIRELLPIVERQSPNMHNKHSQELQELGSLIEKSETIFSDDISTNESVGNEEDDNISDSCKSTADIDEALKSRVQLAMDLVPSLESTLSQIERLAGQSAYTTNEPFHASKPAQVYISLVRDKFPEADKELIERLGEANWQRHINIRRRLERIDDKELIERVGEANWERHVNIRRRLERVETSEGPAPLSSIEAETIIGSKFQPQTLFHDSGIGTSDSAGSYATPPDAAQALAAPSEASHTSFISSFTETEKEATRVPPTPAEVSLGKPFRCFLCGHLQFKIKDRVGWKLHVFQDLLPYLCTFPNCKEELRQFPTRDAWFEHESQEHCSIRVWDCPACPAECSNLTAWSTHLKETHDRVFEPSKHLAVADAACRHVSNDIDDAKCHLCNEQLERTQRGRKTHMGRHMEQIALLALPKVYEEDSDDDSSFVEDEEASANVGERIVSMYESCKDTDLRKRPKYKDVRELIDSLSELHSKPAVAVDVEKELNRNEDWMRKGTDLFRMTTGTFNLLNHLTDVMEQNNPCFDLADRPRFPDKPRSRSSTADLQAIKDRQSREIFCFCRRGEAGQMIECEFCHEWYHTRCLKIDRGTIQGDDGFTCPICDLRVEIPRDALRPKFEDLVGWQAEIYQLPFQPEESDVLEQIINTARTFRDFMRRYVNSISPRDLPYKVATQRFYLRKIEGAQVLLAYETNFFRQELKKWAFVGPTPPPVFDQSHAARTPRPIEPIESLAFSVSDPSDPSPQSQGVLDNITQHSVTDIGLTGTLGTSQQASIAAVAEHACPFCHKTFGRLADMNRHAATHVTTAKRHECLIGNCEHRGSQGFYRRDKLLTHQRTVHGYTL